MTSETPAELGIEGISDATPVGQGRFATVYRATQEALDRTVAVKVFNAPVYDQAARRRFTQECRLVAAMAGHPHIAALYDWGHTLDGRPYQVTEYLPGGTLAERIGEFGALTWEDAADTGVKLAGALAAAHGSGVLHGDVKPENVLVSSFDEPKLSDFEGAQAPTGSPAHAAPEVLNGEPVTERSDVYALASTVYALAAGYAPFEGPGGTGDGTQTMQARILSEAPADLREAGVPDPVWAALAAALAKDPTARTSSARALGEALRAAQRAAGATPTRMVDRVPVAGIDPPAVPPLINPVPGSVLAAAPATRAVPVPAATEPERRRVRPAWIAALAVALVVLLGGAALALTTWNGDDDDDDVAQPIVTTLPVTTATVAPTTTLAPLTTTSPTPTTSPAPPTTRPGPATTVTTAAGPTTTRATGIAACAPSFFRATVTSERSSYRNGETVQVVARFENISGRPCSYSSTGATSQVLRPNGEPLTPVRTLPGSNDDGVPFEPGTAQTFSSFWNVSICNPPGTCFPGRYTMVVDVTPFGGGRVSFDVTGP